MKIPGKFRKFIKRSACAAALTVFLACACEAAASTPTFTATFTRTPTPVISSVWRVNAGGPLYPDTWGNTWT
ncbi:MAG TPA: hypothetical protein P5511_05810, partial [Candidatus Goldiibacteriota bacterium]|nr:hypothetical protein [Candidatus Goldiibacteriota bacterium]